MNALEDIARIAYEEWQIHMGGDGSWYDLSLHEQEAWKNVARVVVKEAAGRNALQILEG